jgi:hypothetical protein
MNCKYCNSPDTEDRGKQRGIHLESKRWFDFTIWQCNGCGTSFAFDSDKRFVDGDCEPVPPKAQVLA